MKHDSIHVSHDSFWREMTHSFVTRRICAITYCIIDAGLRSVSSITLGCLEQKPYGGNSCAVWVVNSQTPQAVFCDACCKLDNTFV